MLKIVKIHIITLSPSQDVCVFKWISVDISTCNGIPASSALQHMSELPGLHWQLYEWTYCAASCIKNAGQGPQFIMLHKMHRNLNNWTVSSFYITLLQREIWSLQCRYYCTITPLLQIMKSVDNEIWASFGIKISFLDSLRKPLGNRK